MERQLQLANEALGDAQYLLQDNRLKAAASRAYYSMFHTVQAALASEGLTRPKRHGGAFTLSGKHYVRTGRVARTLFKDLQDAYSLRQQSDYEVYAAVAEDRVVQAVVRAGEVVA